MRFKQLGLNSLGEVVVEAEKGLYPLDIEGFAGLEPQSDKEIPEVERTNDEEVEVTNVVIPVNVNEEEDEITDEVYELKRREKWKIVEESRSTPLETDIRQKDEKLSKNGQNQARNGKAWKRQSQIEAKVNPDKVKAKKSSSQRKYNFRDQICQILKLYNKDKYYKD
ncbi:hypothetical protein Tco_0046055 [Tanacetum coccineum]